MTAMALFVMAGCFGTEKPTPTPTVTSTMPGTPTATCDAATCPVPPVTPPANVHNVTMNECMGYQHNFVVPRGYFVPDYPGSIESGGDLESGGLDIFVCGQSLIGQTVVHGLEFVFFYSVIGNPDDQENQTDAQLFAFEFFSNSPAFIAFAQQHNLTVALAPNFGPVSRTPIAANEDLTHYAYPSDSPYYNFTGQVDHTAGSDYDWSYAVYYTGGDSTFRFVGHKQGNADTANHGTMEFGPESYWTKNAVSNRADDLLNYYANMTLELSFDPVWQLGA